MKKNGVRPDAQTSALLFSKNLHFNNIYQANLNLAEVLNSPHQYFSLIKVNDLKTFFEQSLNRDNFDGLGHLANYIERNHIDISRWEIGRFRSALDFYLNHTFDINKILTFTRFYIHYANCALNRGNIREQLQDVKNLSEEDQLNIYHQIFIRA